MYSQTRKGTCLLCNIGGISTESLKKSRWAEESCFSDLIHVQFACLFVHGYVGIFKQKINFIVTKPELVTFRTCVVLCLRQCAFVNNIEGMDE